MAKYLITSLVCVLVACSVAVVPALGDHPVEFEVKLLAIDTNEGCDIADFDGDGKLDVVAGRNWYSNGQWVPHRFGSSKM